MLPTFYRTCENSRPHSPTRRQFLSGVALAALAIPLSGQRKPTRIVSTAPSITEALFALDLGSQVVGVCRFSKFPASVQTLPKVGTFLAPDAEAIARLLPDLVILRRISSELTGRLQALHINFIEVPQATLDDVYTEISLIAQAAGIAERAGTLNARIKRELGAIEADVRERPRPRVLMILDRGAGMIANLTAVGPNTYLEQLIEIAGGTNVLAKPGLPSYPRIALETVLREDPDVILDLSSEHDSEAERQAVTAQVLHLWSQQAQLTAVRKGRVIVRTSNALLVPGPRAPQAARMLFDYIHQPAAQGRAG